MGYYVDDTNRSRFTKRAEVTSGSPAQFYFLNEYEYSTWAGDVEVTISVFRPEISSTEVGSVVEGGSFVISGGVYTESDIDTRFISSNIDGIITPLFGIGADSKSMLIQISNSGPDCSAVCDVEFTNAYGFHVIEK